MGQRGPIGRTGGAWEAVAGSPEAPSGLSPTGRREWSRVIALLRERGMLDDLDATLLADYAICFERLQAAEKEVTDKGLLVEGQRGCLVKNPALGVARQYRDSLIRISAQLGLTPSSRARLDAPKHGEADELEEILGGQGGV
jgi:P27 family predicted phage terminase small subunit